MDKNEQPTNHIQVHETADSNLKLALTVILVIIAFSAMAWAGLKWRGQILEYKNNINQKDQQITNLDNEIKKLKNDKLEAVPQIEKSQ
mgnify:CR=1 FL=1